MRGEDELATLGRSFNAMADSIESQIKELADLSLVQQRFVSDVSHELRTPLTTIRLAADMINDQRDEFDPATARAAELLNAQVQRFEVLLTDLLEISRYDAGSVQLELEPTSLAHLAEDVIASMQQLADQHGTDVRLVAPGGYSPVDMDPRRVRRVVRNLLGNAIEHGEGRPIVVTVDSDQQAVALGVRDYGLGMTPAGRRARLRPLLAGRPVAHPHDRRHRPRTVDRARRRAAARRRARRLVRARSRLELRADPPAAGRPAHRAVADPGRSGRRQRGRARRTRADAADRRASRRCRTATPPSAARDAVSPGRLVMTRRRGILSAALVAVALVLSACAGLPTSGPVNHGLDAGRGRRAAGLLVPARPARSRGRRPRRSSRASSARARVPGSRATGSARANSSPPTSASSWNPTASVTIDLSGDRVYSLDRGGLGVAVARRRRGGRRERRLRADRCGPDAASLRARPAGGRRVADHRGARRDRARPRRLPERLPRLLGDVLRSDLGVSRARRAVVPHRERAVARRGRRSSTGRRSEWLAESVVTAFPESVAVSPSVPPRFVGCRRGRPQRVRPRRPTETLDRMLHAARGEPRAPPAPPTSS